MAVIALNKPHVTATSFQSGFRSGASASIFSLTFHPLHGSCFLCYSIMLQLNSVNMFRYLVDFEWVSERVLSRRLSFNLAHWRR